MSHPVFTEGVTGDGAAILRDGKPMTISEVIIALESGQKALDLLRSQRKRYHNDLLNLSAGISKIFRISSDLADGASRVCIPKDDQ